MPLLRNGQLVANNPWVRLDNEDDFPVSGPVPGSTSVDDIQAPPVLVGLQRFLALPSMEQGQVSGVWIAPEDDVAELAGLLDQVQVIAIDFPAYTDGRGYSHARTLRKRFGFAGEIRAMGDVRPGHLLFMMRAGIDAFDFTETPDLELVGKIVSRYVVNYQPSYALPIAG